MLLHSSVNSSNLWWVWSVWGLTSFSLCFCRQHNLRFLHGPWAEPKDRKFWLQVFLWDETGTDWLDNAELDLSGERFPRRWTDQPIFGLNCLLPGPLYCWCTLVWGKYSNRLQTLSWLMNFSNFPLFTNGLFSSKFGIVHCTYLELSGYNFLKILLSEDLFHLNK